MKNIRSANPASIAAATCLYEMGREFIPGFLPLSRRPAIIAFITWYRASEWIGDTAADLESHPGRRADFGFDLGPC
jgi:hypothetical protein